MSILTCFKDVRNHSLPGLRVLQTVFERYQEIEMFGTCPVLPDATRGVVHPGLPGFRLAVSSERSLSSTALTLAPVSWTRCTSLAALTYGNGHHQNIFIEPLCSSCQSYFYLVINYFNPAALLIGTWYVNCVLHGVMWFDVSHLSGLQWCAQLLFATPDRPLISPWSPSSWGW